MPGDKIFCVQAQCLDIYEKFIRAGSRREAELKALKEEFDEDGWERIDGSSQVLNVTELKQV